jgi:hypothetical protein
LLLQLGVLQLGVLQLGVVQLGVVQLGVLPLLSKFQQLFRKNHSYRKAILAMLSIKFRLSLSKSSAKSN